MKKDIPLKDMIGHLRKVLPGQIAKDILSVQPMTGRGGKSIFASLYHNKPGVHPPKEVFNHFLRVNNRKNLYRANDFLDAGYPYVDDKITKTDSSSMKYDWMRENMRYRYICINHYIFFANEQDKVLYLLRWSQ